MVKSIQLLAALTAILSAHSFRFSAPMAELWKAGSTKHVEATKKIRVAINPSDGSWKVLIDSNSKIKEGVSDFDGNRLDSEEVFTATGLRVGYDTNANTGKEGVLKYKTAMPASIRNSILRLKQGEVDLFDKEISLLNNGVTATNLTDEIIPLKIPVVIVGGKSFDFGIQYPEGATAATDKEYLEIVFVGFVTKRSSTRS